MAEAEQKSGSKKVLGCLLIVLGLPVLLCCGLATTWFVRESSARAEVDRMLSELEERGQPIGNESLTRYRASLSSDENAARWMAVLERIGAKPFQDTTRGVPFVGVVPDAATEYPVRGEVWGYEDAAREFLEQNASLRSEMHDVVEGTGPIRTKLEFDSYNTLLPYVQHTRDAARIVMLENRVAVHDGDAEGSLHAILAMLGIARSIEHEPLMVSQLVYSAVVAMAAKEIGHALESDLLDEDQLNAIGKELEHFGDYKRSYQVGMSGERAMVMAVFGGGESTIEAGPPIRSSRDQLASLELFETAEKAIEEATMADFLERLDQHDSLITQRISSGNLLTQFDTMLTGLLMPAIRPFGQACAETAQEVRMAKIAIALRQFERKFDRWPQDLGELTQVGVDSGSADLVPFGGKPFGYKVLENEVELWAFPISSGVRETPAEPKLLSSLEEREAEQWGRWQWKLQRD